MPVSVLWFAALLTQDHMVMSLSIPTHGSA